MSAESLSDGAPPRALITGFRGFTWHYLARELEAGVSGFRDSNMGLKRAGRAFTTPTL
jgi:hypothetical protein